MAPRKSPSLPKQKSTPGSQKKKIVYTEKTLQDAIYAVKTQGLSKKAAAKQFSVPRATLLFRLSDKFRKLERGPDPVLSREEETILTNWVIKCSRKGFPRRKDDIKTSVQNTSVVFDNVDEQIIRETPKDVQRSSIQNWINAASSSFGQKSANSVKPKLRELLQSPKTPKRKGIRKTPKMNFVLTGRAAKIMQHHKLQEKEREIREKAERKAERERKKIEKEKEKSSRKSKRGNVIEGKKTCEKCNTQVAENPLICLTCKKSVIHSSCFNSDNSNVTTVCKDYDIFVCQICLDESENDPDNFGL